MSRLAGLSLLLCVAACGGSAGTAPEQAPQHHPAPPAEESTTTVVDFEKIFPPGAGRELALNNCQNCHTFVPIVILQMDKDAWHRNSLDHRDRVSTLSDQEYTVLYDYLAANFNPDRPVPVLPQALLESWTSY